MDEKSYIEVVGWEQFQHYKSHNPSWIKLYQKLLSNYSFRALPDHEKYLLIAIWLMAARSQNRTRLDEKDIKAIAGIKSKRFNLSGLVGAGFIKINQGLDSINDSIQNETPKPKPNPKKRKKAEPKKEEPRQSIWAWWVDVHRELGKPDPVKNPVDLGHVKTIQAMGLADDVIKAMLKRYLMDTDHFVANQGHPLRLFAGRANKYQDDKTVAPDYRGGSEHEKYN